MSTSPLSVQLPRYRRHKASGQAVVTLSGQDHYLGKYNTAESKREYRRLIAQWLAPPDQATALPFSDLTVVELAAAYVKHARSYYRKNGRITREAELIREVCKFVSKHCGRELACYFGPKKLKAVRQAWVEKGDSRGVINKNIDRIRRMFRWAASEELAPESVYASLKTVSGLRRGRSKARETLPVLPIDDETVERTLQHLPQVVADMVRFQRLTGCRPSEVCAIRPVDIDTSEDIWRYVPFEHKTQHQEKERLVCIGPKAQDILHPYLRRDARTFCFSPADSERKRRALQHTNRETPLSCGNRPGTNRRQKRARPPRDRYDTGSYRRAIHRACDRAAVQRWSPNRLRHASATEIRKQFGLEAAQVALGHSAANVTQIYAQRDVALATRVAKEVG